MASKPRNLSWKLTACFAALLLIPSIAFAAPISGWFAFVMCCKWVPSAVNDPNTGQPYLCGNQLNCMNCIDTACTNSHRNGPGQKACIQDGYKECLANIPA